ncbi:MAG: O-methyltransferase [Lachnospiraceae bacterium]|nr:O-methyltransferase [Lachnospiraceae bacterium]
MIDSERLSIYLNSIERDNTKLLNLIEKEAIASYVPIIRKDMQYLLRTLLTMNRPKKILEVGTAIGFSAILMGEFTDNDCTITTIENYDKRIPIARENIKRAGMEDRITLIEGDAQDVLKEIDDTFDFVFMDAAKGQYINFLPDIKRLTESGAVIVTDNVLQDGDILESHFIVDRRNRTIHKRIRDYLYELCQDERYDTTILSVGDGVALTVVR